MLPDWLLPHTSVIEPHEGDGAYGPIFGPAVSEPCLVDDERRMVRDAQGAEIVSNTTIIYRPGTRCPEGSRITVNGRVVTAIASYSRDGGGLPTPDHVEVVCR